HPLLAFHLTASQINNFTAFSLSPSAISHQPSASLNDFTNPLFYGLWPFSDSHLPSAISPSLHDFTNQQLYDFMCWLSAICYQPSASSLSLHDFTNRHLYGDTLWKGTLVREERTGIGSPASAGRHNSRQEPFLV